MAGVAAARLRVASDGQAPALAWAKGEGSGGGSGDGSPLLVAEAVSPTNFLTFAGKAQAGIPSSASGYQGPYSSYGAPMERWPEKRRPRDRRQQIGLGSQWIMCRGTPGTPDGCLLCRLRLGMSCEDGPRRAGSAPRFRAGKRYPRLLENAASLTSDDTPAAAAAAPLPKAPEKVTVVDARAQERRQSFWGQVANVTSAAAGLAQSAAQSATQPAAAAAEPPSWEPQHHGGGGAAEPAAPAAGGGDERPRTPPRPRTPSASGEKAADKKSALWKLEHRRTKKERMAFIDHSLKVRRRHEVTGVLQDQVSNPEAKELASEAFHRYFPQKGSHPWDRRRVLQALADFGLKAHARLEGLAFATVLDRHSQRATVDFGAFLYIIEECRGGLRAALAEPLWQAWKYVDLQDLGAIDRSQCWQLLNSLRLAPMRTEKERRGVQTLIRDLDWDRFGLVTMHEVEFFVLQVRELRESSRRLAELQLCNQYEMPSETFDLFRGELLELHDAFHVADEDGSGALDADEILHVLSDFGCLRGHAEREKGEGIIEDVMGQAGGGQIEFEAFLVIVQRLRTMEKSRRRDEITAMFKYYDADESGELDAREFSAFLVDLDMLPRTQQQREGLAQLIQESDADGSGLFNLQEVEHLVQQASENLLRVQREAENDRGSALKFNRLQVYALRKAWETVDRDQSHGLSLPEVHEATRMMKLKIDQPGLARIMGEVDFDASGQLNFNEFMELVRRIEEDLQQQEEHSSSRHEQPEEPLSPASMDSPMPLPRASAVLRKTGGGQPPAAAQRRRASVKISAMKGLDGGYGGGGGGGGSSAPGTPSTPRGRSRGSRFSMHGEALAGAVGRAQAHEKVTVTDLHAAQQQHSPLHAVRRPTLHVAPLLVGPE